MTWIDQVIPVGTYVPYTGADKEVDLGSEDLTTTGLGSFGTLDVSGASDMGAVDVAGNLQIIGSYVIRWRDNGDTVSYGYMRANVTSFVISSVNVPLQFLMGAAGGALACEVSTAGDWDFQDGNLVTTGTAGCSMATVSSGTVACVMGISA